MPTSLLSGAYAHHVWATIRQLDACAALNEAQLATTVPGTYGSILDTLRHIVDGDVFYLNILRGEPEPFDKDACDIPTGYAKKDYSAPFASPSAGFMPGMHERPTRWPSEFDSMPSPHES